MRKGAGSALWVGARSGSGGGNVSSAWDGNFTGEIASGGVTLNTVVAVRQVYQKNGVGLEFTGGHTTDVAPTGMAVRGGSGGTWSQLTNETIDGSTWTGTTTFPYYGQGDLQFAPINGDGTTEITIAVPNITVTDIIVVNGQSNAVGQATNAQTYTKVNYDWMVADVGGVYVVKTQDPVWSATSGSFFPALAELLDADGIPPAFLSGTVASATSFVGNNWNEGDASYNTTVSRLNTALPLSGGAKAHFWIQAEGDANTTAAGDAWDDAFVAMLTAMEGDVTSLVGIPCFITIIGEKGGAVGIDNVRISIQNVLTTDSRTKYGPNLVNEDFGDGTHYGTVAGGVDTAAAEAQLDRIASFHKRCLDAEFYGGSDPAKGAAMTSLSIGTGANANKITIDFDRALANHSDIGCWTVVDSEGARTVSSGAQGASASQIVLTCDQILYGAVTVSHAEDETAVGSTLVDTGTPAIPPDYAYQTSAGTGPGVAASIATAPAVSGAPQEDVAYSCNNGTYNGIPAATTDAGSLQWQISDDGATGWSDISAATSATYTPVTADVTKYLRRGETGSNAINTTARQYSNASDAIIAASSFTDPSDDAAVYEWWDCSDTASITLNPDPDAETIDSQLVGGTTLDRSGGSSFSPHSGTRTQGASALNTLDFDGGVQNRMYENAANTTLPQFAIRAGDATKFRGEMVAQDASFTTITASDVDRGGMHLWGAWFNSTSNLCGFTFDGASLGTSAYTGSQDGHVFVWANIDGSSNANDTLFINDATVGFSFGKWLGGQYLDGAWCEGVVANAQRTGTDLSNLETYGDRWDA